MKRLHASLKMVAAAAAGVLLSSSAFAFPAYTTSHLYLRTGPGPQYPIIADMELNARLEVHGCLKGVTWCDVNLGQLRGWASAQYIVYDAPGGAVHLASAGDAIGIPLTTYEAVDVVAPVGAITALAYGTPAPVAIVPHADVHAYVGAQTIQPVFLTGEVVIGVTLPAVVPLYAVPQSPYHFAYVNGVRVLVEHNSRRVLYVYR